MPSEAGVSPHRVRNSSEDCRAQGSRWPRFPPHVTLGRRLSGSVITGRYGAGVSAGESLDVTAWTVEQPEAGGGGQNRWLRDPEDRRWLYKATRINRHNGQPQGEDWAEKAVEGLASLIGVPTAHVEVAHVVRSDGVELGVISRDLAVDMDLQGGFMLLADVPGYRFRDERGRPPRDHVGHTVANVRRALQEQRVRPPVGFAPGSFTAFDVFAGFLLLDAWVGNQDRHEENWAVLRSPDAELSLAPSFDHGASLGFLLSEEQRALKTSDGDAMRTFAQGGKATKFEGRRLELVEVAADALRQAGPEAQSYWYGQLERVDTETCATVLASVPRLSEGSRNFCLQLLDINRRRLLDVCR